MTEDSSEIRALRLFKYSPLKRQKFREIDSCLGSTRGLRCLELGSGNGVISLLLREHGGTWVSADPDVNCVRATRALVKENVYHLADHRLPFRDDEFDRIVIVDCLEHIEEDGLFVEELHRVAKSNAELVLNVPYSDATILEKISERLLSLNETHGHLRDGYDLEGLHRLLQPWFTVSNHKTYMRFFSRLVDFGMTLTVRIFTPESSKAGTLLDLEKMNSDPFKFKFLAVLTPFLNFLISLDSLLPRRRDRMLIAKAFVNNK